MSRLHICQVLALAGLGLLAANVSAQKTYRWVDKDGVVRYSDSVPPDQASQDRDILNSQGVKVGSQQGEITDAERAVMEAEAREKAERDQQIADQQRRDKMLLDTYVTTDDIESLRDRRLDSLKGQMSIFEIYLGNFHKRLTGLLADAERYSPRNTDEDAKPLPDFLARDIENTQASIHNYEALLEENRKDQDKIREAFEQDIIRFRELKRLPPPAAAETASASLAGRKVSN